MICYNCARVSSCSTYKKLCTMSDDFCINDCQDFDKASVYKYKKIADNDILMKLIYDYFTGNVAGYSEDTAKQVIRNTLSNM